MKRIFLLCGSILLTATLLFFSPIAAVSYAERLELDSEETDFLAVRFDAKQNAGKNVPRIKLPQKEVKFVAGKDGKWFTDDDEVYHYFLAEYNNKGQMTERTCYGIGKDKILFSNDDPLKEFLVFEFDAQGRQSKKRSFKVISSSKIVEDYYSVPEFDVQGREVKDVRYRSHTIIGYLIFEYGPLGKVVKDVEYSGPGPDGVWFGADDEIKKYHRREYRSDGKPLHAMEYLIDQQGRGADNQWFTADDVVSSARVFCYDDAGFVNKVNKYIDKGADGRWFTDDDVLQYYTLRYYVR